MSTRTEIAKIREQVDRLGTVAAAKSSEYGDDPCGLMTAGGQAPDPWQREILENTSDDLLELITRQGGKSTTAAAKALHTALYEPGALFCWPVHLYGRLRSSFTNACISTASQTRS